MNELALPTELANVPQRVLKDFLVQYSRFLLSSYAPGVTDGQVHSLVSDYLSGAAAGQDRPADVLLEFRHNCRFTGCNLEDCPLCRNNPNKVCEWSEVFDKQYWVRDDGKGGQLVKARCGADVGVALLDKNSGRPLMLQDTLIKLYVVNGQGVAAPATTEPAGGLYYADDGHRLYAAAGAAPEEDGGLLLDMVQDDMLGPVALIPEFQFLDKNSKFKQGGRTFKSFKFMARVIRRDAATGREQVLAQVESQAFKVTTKKGYDGCRKAEYLYAHQPITDKTFVSLGETTISNLKTTFEGTETVEDLMRLVQASTSQPDLQARLRETLNMSRDADKWKKLIRMLSEKVVWDDSLQRLFVVPTGGRPLGLLFRANRAQVDFDTPLGLVLDCPLPTGQLRAIRANDRSLVGCSRLLDALKRLAVSYWGFARHPGWTLVTETPRWEHTTANQLSEAFMEVLGSGDPAAVVDMHLSTLAAQQQQLAAAGALLHATGPNNSGNHAAAAAAAAAAGGGIAAAGDSNAFSATNFGGLGGLMLSGSGVGWNAAGVGSGALLGGSSGGGVLLPPAAGGLLPGGLPLGPPSGADAAVTAAAVASSGADLQAMSLSGASQGGSPQVPLLSPCVTSGVSAAGVVGATGLGPYNSSTLAPQLGLPGMPQQQASVDSVLAAAAAARGSSAGLVTAATAGAPLGVAGSMGAGTAMLTSLSSPGQFSYLGGGSALQAPAALAAAVAAAGQGQGLHAGTAGGVSPFAVPAASILQSGRSTSGATDHTSDSGLSIQQQMQQHRQMQQMQQQVQQPRGVPQSLAAPSASLHLASLAQSDPVRSVSGPGLMQPDPARTVSGLMQPADPVRTVSGPGLMQPDSARTLSGLSGPASHGSMGMGGAVALANSSTPRSGSLGSQAVGMSGPASGPMPHLSGLGMPQAASQACQASGLGPGPSATAVAQDSSSLLEQLLSSAGGLPPGSGAAPQATTAAAAAATSSSPAALQLGGPFAVMQQQQLQLPQLPQQQQQQQQQGGAARQQVGGQLSQYTMMLQQAIIEGWPAPQVKAVLDQMSDDELQALVEMHAANEAVARGSSAPAAAAGAGGMMAGRQAPAAGHTAAAAAGGAVMNDPALQGFGSSITMLPPSTSGLAQQQQQQQQGPEAAAATAAATASIQQMAPPPQPQQQQQKQQQAGGRSSSSMQQPTGEAAAAALTALFADAGADGDGDASGLRAMSDVQLPADQTGPSSGQSLTHLDLFTGDSATWGDILLDNLRHISSGSGNPPGSFALQGRSGPLLPFGGTNSISTDWIPELLSKLESGRLEFDASAVPDSQAGGPDGQPGASKDGPDAAQAGPDVAQAGPEAVAEDRARKSKRERSKTGQAPTVEQLAELQSLFGEGPFEVRSLSKAEGHFDSFNRHFPVARLHSKTTEVQQGVQVAHPWAPGQQLASTGVAHPPKVQPPSPDSTSPFADLDVQQQNLQVQQQPQSHPSSPVVVSTAAVPGASGPLRSRPPVTTHSPQPVSPKTTWTTTVTAAAVGGGGRGCSSSDGCAAAAAAVSTPPLAAPPTQTEEGAVAVENLTGLRQQDSFFDMGRGGLDAGREASGTGLRAILELMAEEEAAAVGAPVGAAGFNMMLASQHSEGDCAAAAAAAAAASLNPFADAASQPMPPPAPLLKDVPTMMQRDSSGRHGWISSLFRRSSSWSSKSNSGAVGSGGSGSGPSGGSHTSKDAAPGLTNTNSVRGPAAAGV